MQRETDDGVYLYYTENRPGRPAVSLLPNILPEALNRLSLPKRMRWGSGDWAFARPVHWVLALFGSEVVPCEIAGIEADRLTRGHRYHAPEPVHLHEADWHAYHAALTEQFVLAGADYRYRQVEGEVCNAARQAGGTVGGLSRIGDLLAEVTGLVEWPVAFTGRFDETFLELPREVLVTSMEKHQKFFPVVDGQDRLQPVFVGVANIDSADPQALRAGHERVLRARLADARFFWDADRQGALADRVDDLKQVVFQAKLGTLYDKTERLAVLAPVVAEAMDPSVASLAERAGWLAKADLLTEMVDEFDTLQGIMGAYYATADGEDPQVAAALAEQYRPAQAGDDLPATGTGTALALADRLDTIVGCFGIGLEPTGSKDPFALRRSAIGILRMAIEGGIHLDLPAVVRRTYRAFGGRMERDEAETVDAVVDFLNGRLEPMYTEAADQPVHADVVTEARRVAAEQGTAVADVDRERVDAILSLRPTDPYDAHLRLKGLLALLAHPAAESLISANKRTGNILRKTEEAVPETFDRDALQEDEERTLAEAFEGVRDRFERAAGAGDYTTALLALAELREPVDRFFDAVMVMAEDDALRRNRLALLQAIHGAFLQVADLSRLPG